MLRGTWEVGCAVCASRHSLTHSLFHTGNLSDPMLQTFFPSSAILQILAKEVDLFGLRVQSLGFTGSGFRVQGCSEFTVQGSGFKLYLIRMQFPGTLAI